MNTFDLRTSSGLLDLGTNAYGGASSRTSQKMADFTSAFQRQLYGLRRERPEGMEAYGAAVPQAVQASAALKASGKTCIYASGSGFFQDILVENPEEIPEESTVSLTKEEIFENLSEDAKITLGKIKFTPYAVEEDEWNGLMDELWQMGVISGPEHLMSRPGAMMIPIVTRDGGKTWQAAFPPQEIQQEMNAAKQWDCGPIAYIDKWIESLKKWRSWLYEDLSHCKEPVYQGLSAIDGQVDGWMHISQVVQDLIS